MRLVPKVFSDSSSRQSQKDAQIRRAKRFAADGLYSRACEALTSEGLHEFSREIVKELKDLHPPGDLFDLGPLPDTGAEPLEFSPEQVQSALDSFPKDSAHGKSCLKAQHLKDAVNCKSPVVADRALSNLTKLVNLLVAGEGVQEVIPFFCGAPLYALKKPEGGVRPIAIGETLRRLVGKCCARDEYTKSICQSLLEPCQMGVSTRCGAEAIVRAVNAIVDATRDDTDVALLKVDLRNAFNRVSREVVLKEVDKHAPGLAAWARWCYSEHSHLWAGSTVIDSAQGVQQGDALGPFLFSLAMQSLFSKSQRK